MSETGLGKPEPVSRYPEHDKLTKIASESQVIGEFLEWIQQEHGISLGFMDAIMYEPLSLCGSPYERMEFVPWRGGKDDLLALFFNIDLVKLEAEKRQMLADYRSAHG